jgi:hypothetical protein
MLRWIIILTVMAWAGNAHAQDSSRYTRLNTYGQANKRGVFDSVLIAPVKNASKPASQIAYRAGAIRFNPEFNAVEFYNGAEWVLLDGGGGGGSTPVNYYTDYFTGTSNNFYSTIKTPIIPTVNVFVNGVKIPKSSFSVSNKAIQINSSLLSYGTDSGDKVEIIYQSVN